MALIKQIGKSVEELVNFHNVPIVVGFLPGKQLRTMGSEHLSRNIEKLFKPYTDATIATKRHRENDL